ncbi:hypothetical protein Pth03_63940 [Planotetraspora thailandica]|uniref:CsbD-like domain-containing protein n=1 Tax=Planotetraspora thailandica TaxID=487172 RepID=A0A8J3VG33_9ACTN|nr:CsbD family protein [Planotetraspora thailandica]GII58005.1 hypothetical protein Pth03_63940 [Planotetraspora thailandica]
MGARDKIRNKAREAAGAVKKAAGKVVGNENLEAQGHADESKGRMRQAGERMKDAASRVKGSFKA